MYYLITRYKGLDEMKEAYNKLREASAFMKDFPKTAAEQNTDRSLYYVTAFTIEEAIEEIICIEDYYITHGIINLLILDIKGRLYQYNGYAKLRFEKVYENKFKKGTFSPLLSFQKLDGDKK